eukprot:5845030-Pleurochrysis_carterae.AAC.2
MGMALQVRPSPYDYRPRQAAPRRARAVQQESCVLCRAVRTRRAAAPQRQQHSTAACSAAEKGIGGQRHGVSSFESYFLPVCYCASDVRWVYAVVHAQARLTNDGAQRWPPRRAPRSGECWSATSSAPGERGLRLAPPLSVGLVLTVNLLPVWCSATSLRTGAGVEYRA